jgi:glycosyltransferase involved in cell wall biosynthesis
VGDDRALAHSLNALIRSPEKQSEMKLASVQRARQFSIEKTVDEYIRMYESVLQAS